MDSALSKEELILKAVKGVLAKVVRDTAVPPGMLHPLNSDTLDDIRHCFSLISMRERELAAQAGQAMEERPHFTDERGPAKDTVIPLSAITRRSKK